MTAREIQDRLRALGNPEAAAFAARYFKTGPGQYGEGDVFLGLRAKVMHALAREYKSLRASTFSICSGRASTRIACWPC